MNSTMRSQVARTLLTCLIAVLLFNCQPLAAKPNLPAWDAFVSQFIDSYFSIHPSFAVNAGRHEFDGKIDDWSQASLGKQKRWLESERKKAIQYHNLALK